ncbi:MAG: nucleotidyltransferase domain-containing protein [Candidatus Aenigmarchaeota archaeon]|nr:nucleotidyltransferase domain-containing protein [Candidatus Aenigmarchaeota archaeon]
MLEDILNTKVKTRIAILFSIEKNSLQISDVARKLAISKSRASECLRELETNGLLKSKSIGRSIVYELSSTKLAGAMVNALEQDEKLLSELENSLKKELAKLNPESIVRFGSSVTVLKPGSDIDIMVLLKKNISKDEIYKISAKLSEEFGIHISIMAMSVEEYRKKARNGEEFALKVAATHILIYGKDLEDIIWQKK